MVRAVHQLLIGATKGDAITNMAFNIRERLGDDSKIYAYFPDESVREEVRDFGELAAEEPPEVLVYHASYGIPRITHFLRQFRGRLILYYHNITPAKFFVDLDPEFALGLSWGREELTLLRDQVSLSVTPSQYNARELEQFGLSSVVVCPAGLDPERLSNEPLDVRLVRRLSEHFPHGYVVSIAQMLPHKRIEDAVATVHQLQLVHGMKCGLVIVGADRLGEYSNAIRRFANELLGGSCLVLGKVSDSSLASVLKNSLAYIGVSKHEGFSVPLVEAMALMVPAVVREAGAVRDTASAGAIVLDSCAGPSQLAESLARILTGGEEKIALLARAKQRVRELDKELLLDQFFDATGIGVS